MIFASVVLPLIILVRTSLLSRWGLPISWQNLTLKNYAAFADTSTIVPAALFNSTLISAVDGVGLRRAGADHRLDRGADAACRAGGFSLSPAR